MIKPLHKAVLAIDFDKTIAHTEYPKIHHLHDNAKDVINRLYDQYFYIIIWTCRSGSYVDDVATYLKNHNINYHLINEQHPYLKYRFNNDTRKISADIYIDDKDIHAQHNPNFPDFLTIEDQITQIVERPTFNTILNY